MGYTQAIGRRHRVIRRANARAQARFHAAFDAGVITDETARATRLYVEAERLIDRLIAPEVPPTPVEVVVQSLHWPLVDFLPCEKFVPPGTCLDVDAATPSWEPCGPCRFLAAYRRKGELIPDPQSVTYPEAVMLAYQSGDLS